MRIVCPACSAAYEVPDSLLSPGRRVRCARCARDWEPAATAVQQPAPAEPPAETGPPAQTEPPPEAEQPARPWPDLSAVPEAPVEEVEVEPAQPRFTAMDRLAAARGQARRSRGPLRLAWTASILLLLFLVGAGYIWRAELVHVWPPSARVYHALGVMPPGPVRK